MPHYMSSHTCIHEELEAIMLKNMLWNTVDTDLRRHWVQQASVPLCWRNEFRAMEHICRAYSSTEADTVEKLTGALQEDGGPARLMSWLYCEQIWCMAATLQCWGSAPKQCRL